MIPARCLGCRGMYCHSIHPVIECKTLVNCTSICNLHFPSHNHIESFSYAFSCHIGLLSTDISAIKMNAEALLDTDKWAGLDRSTENTKYIFFFHHHNHNIKTINPFKMWQSLYILH
jgi:hypothetical protein